MGWIFIINQFFDYHRIPQEEDLSLLSSTWKVSRWAGTNICFVTASSLRGSKSYVLLKRDFPQATTMTPVNLFSNTQCGSLNQYLKDFTQLANLIVGLPPPSILSCFVLGLSPDIRCEVQVLLPNNLWQAITLAKIQEDNIEEQRRGFTNKISTETTPTNHNPFHSS